VRANEIISEVKMTPSTFAGAIESSKGQGVLVGYEFEVCVPKSPNNPPSKYASERYKDAAKIVATKLNSVTDSEVVVFNDYHEREKKLDRWYIEPDSSLESKENDVALEIVSPPIPAETAIETLKNFYKMARELKLYTGKKYNTGLHINMSIPKDLDVLKLALFLGDQYVLKSFGREDNYYAASVLGELEGQISPNDAYKVNKKKTEIKFKKLKEIVTDVVEDHYVSINVPGNYVSFRHVGGNYLKNYKSILDVIGRFMQAMIIASDENLYRNEYIKKLTKLVGYGETPKGPSDLQRMKTLVTKMKEIGIPIITTDFMYNEEQANLNIAQAEALALRYSLDMSWFYDYFDLESYTVTKNSNITKQRLLTTKNKKEFDKPRTEFIHTVYYPYMNIQRLENMYYRPISRMKNIIRQDSTGGFGWEAKAELKFLPFTDPIAQQFYSKLLDQIKNPNMNESREYPENPTYYFAYGMLTDPTYMKNINLVGVAELRNFEYKMYQYANVEPKGGSKVYGCLWEIDREKISQLDKIEGYPTLYDRRTYPVYVDGKKYPAEVYVMTPNTLKHFEGTAPTDQYVDTVDTGYRNAGIPLEQLYDAVDEADRNQDLYFSYKYSSIQ
jgi:gamma-glutamylcyclotransferase (GGCT)/AIG2-like uncharacterized protein YtfP